MDHLEIKIFLNNNNLRYQWLADQCKVSLSTVRLWLAKGRITQQSLQLIKRILWEYELQNRDKIPPKAPPYGATPEINP